MNEKKEIRKLSELQEWDKNPRTISKDAFERLKWQIQHLKEYKPLLINQDNIVLGGNMRLKAYRELNIKEAWVSQVTTKNESEMWEYALSDNDHVGVTDAEMIANEMPQLDIDWTKYSIDLKPPTPISDLLPQDIEEDEAPELDETETISKYGEVYQLGKHRLMCGDSTKIEEVEKLMGGQKTDMVFTDPPYNVDYGVSKNPRHKIRKIKGDKLDEKGWKAFNNDWIANMILVSKGQADIYVWGASGREGMRQRLWLIEMGYHWSATIVWKKQQLVLTPANYQRKYEPCFYGWLGKSSWQGSRTETEVWEIDRPLNSKLHPTMKPIALCSKGIKNSSKIDDIVLDLFGGSGSTLMACEQIDRACYMMELDPKYCDVIRKRYAIHIDKEDQWQQVTAKV